MKHRFAGGGHFLMFYEVSSTFDHRAKDAGLRQTKMSDGCFIDFNIFFSSRATIPRTRGLSCRAFTYFGNAVRKIASFLRDICYVLNICFSLASKCSVINGKEFDRAWILPYFPSVIRDLTFKIRTANNGQLNCHSKRDRMTRQLHAWNACCDSSSLMPGRSRLSMFPNYLRVKRMAWSWQRKREWRWFFFFFRV